MGFISNLFNTKPQLPPINMGLIGADMHSHFLPGIDDGAKTMDDSIALIKAMKAMGYKKIITTPHIMSDCYRNTPEIIRQKLSEVQSELVKEEIDIEIQAAAEYYLDSDFEKFIAEKNLLTFGKNYVLFEISFMTEPPSLKEAIFNMQLAGYKPVLAHTERYSYWYNDFENYVNMIDRGVILQINILSLIGHYDTPAKKIAEKLIKENMVELIGSDCHNINHINQINICRQQPYLKQLIDSGKLLNSSL
jgi:protein-tyrosine phosphatase